MPRFKHTAVDRNTLKRRLRELIRLELLPAGAPADVVLRVRTDAYDASWEALRADVRDARAQLLRWSSSALESDSTYPPSSAGPALEA